MGTSALCAWLLMMMGPTCATKVMGTKYFQAWQQCGPDKVCGKQYGGNPENHFWEVRAS